MGTSKLSLGAFFSSRTGRIVLHVVFWLVYLNSPIFLMEAGSYSPKGILVFEVLNLLFIPYYYLLAYYLIPRFFKLRLLPIFFLIWVASYTLMSFGVQQLAVVSLPELSTETEVAVFKKVAETPAFYFPEFFRMIFVTMLPLTIMLMRRYSRISTQQTELKRLNADLELNYLKAQMNPHFLFNSLNNIYSLSLQRSDKTPGLVLQLSDLMRYMLYECNAPSVPLDRELQFLRDYTDLEKVRHGEKVRIDFTVKGDTQQKMIAPLMLLPFVENAFKHGVNAQLGPAWVEIHFDADAPAGGCSFEVRNNKPAQHEHAQRRHGGIGLENARKRLDLLYPGKYNLDITDESSLYAIRLIIDKL